MTEPRHGGRLPDPGMGAICGRCGEPREAHGGPVHLGACPGETGIQAKRFSIAVDDRLVVAELVVADPRDRLPPPVVVSATDELVSFVRAQLDARERVALAAANLQFDPENGWGTSGPNTVTPHIGHIHDDEARRHIVLNDPAAVLADIAAKRAILDEYEGYASDDDPDYEHAQFAADAANALEVVIKLLAQPYAGQDGWREEWRT